MICGDIESKEESAVICKSLIQRIKDIARKLDLYDGLVWLGYPFQSFYAWENGQVFKEKLKATPIRRALVSHTLGVLHDPREGNRVLVRELRSLTDTFGVMALAPTSFSDTRELEKYVRDHILWGIRGVRLMPKAHRYTLKTPGVERLIEVLQIYRLPLFIPIGQTSWEEIVPIAMLHPDLSIIVESAGHHEYLNMRHTLPWLRQVSNIYIPTNRQFLAGGLELLVETLSSQRILFCTGQPIEDPWSTITLLALSTLSEDKLLNIAHKNLERLITNVMVPGG